MAVLVSDVITYARQKANTDSNGISDSFGLAWTNDALLDMTRELIARDIDASQVQEAYASVGSTGTFAWPSDMFALKTVEVDFTGSGGSNYIQAGKLDVSNLQFGTSFDYVRANQSVNDPQFTNHGDTGEIFPNQSCTVRIFYFLQPTEYPATSTALAYPQTLDYRILGEKVTASYYEYLATANSVVMADRYLAKYQKRLNDVIKILAPQSQQPIRATPLRKTGWEY